ncbi:MAG: InlB B-repeat-containing protein, partial [Prevotellaceae bacterium]|nr:InlB B-repeat-containing protein [Prevotellaceae bacterium]
MKHFFYLLAFILLNAVMPAGHAQGLSFSGDGSKEHPYEIISSEQLELLLDFCGDAHKNEHFRLMNDLYLTGQWEPIGNSVSWFTGYFHGGGHTIFGLEIDNNAYDYAGFFGYNAGTIDSLYIEGTIKEGGQYTGGLVGYNIGTLEFCHSIVNVSAISNLDSYSGGLVGYNKGVIRNSSAQGDVTAYGATGYSGGLVGYNTNNDSNLGSITNCFARGNVSVLAFGENSTPYSGGLVGYVNSGSVAYCYTTGTPKVSLPYGNHNGLGSVIGYNHQGDISNCYYKAAVGVVGLNGKSGTTIEGKNDAGMKMKEIYVGWDFNDVWGINSIINSAYPYLRKQPLRLSDITVNSNSLSDFDSDTFDYIVDVTAANVTVSATATVTGANISVGNLPAPLATGANLDSITVEHDGGKLVYKIIVHYNYTLKFDANGGLFDMSGVKTSVTTKSVTSGINELPVVPERSGYSFKEWNTKKGGDSISFDAATIQNASGLETLYAQWSPNEYQLKFDVNGGGGVNPTPKTVVFGEKIGYDGTNLPEPVRTGYVFYRWNTLPDGSGDIYTKDTVYRISRDTTVYAQWTANEYKLKFILNYAGATNHPSDMDVTYDSPVGILPTVTRSGYIFNKWTVNPDGSGEIYTDATVFIMNTDVTLYAQWTSHPYTLKFVDTQGKTISPSSIQVNYYDPLAGKFPVLNDRPNYTFIGWNTKSDGSGSIYDDNSKYNLETDTTFYAIWEGDSYELTLDAQGGNVGKTNYPVFYGAAVGALPDPTRTSYIFGGWFTEQNGNGTPYTATTVYDDINIKTLYAKWTAKTYTLTYDPQGGTIDPDSPQQIAYGANTGILPTPIKPNYTFIEWNTKPDRSGDTFNKNGQEYTIDSDITIYAIWKGNSYKIIFDPQGGTVNPSENIVYYNEPVGGLPIPLRTGYIFGGWFTASGGGGTQYTETVYTATNNTTIYAKWIAEKYQLIFDCNYSEGPDLSGQTKNVTYGIAVGDLSNVSVTRTNYTLTGWNTEPNGKGSTYAENTIYYVNGNTTLYAQWTGKEFLITFDANEPGVTDPAPKTVYYNSPVGQLPTDIRPGYTVEWKDLSTNTVYNANTITVGDVKLTAQWTAKNYTLIFNPQGGNVSPENKSVTYGAPVGSLPDGQSTTRIGYTFDDWYTEPNGSTKYVNTPAYNKYNVAGNSTVYAKWTGNPYTLYFNVNGGDGIPDPNSIPVIYGSPVGPLSDAGSKANYTFKEWNTRSDGTGVSYNEGTPYTITAGNATLYAIWQGAPYTLTFEAGGGIVDPETKTVYYNSPVGALPVPVQGGYTFTGWNTQKDGSGDTYTANTVTAGNETLYAQWEGGRTYQIKFNSNYSGGSTNIASITGIKYNEFISDFGKIPVAADLTREHYVFVRWNTEQNGSGINVDETTVYTFYDDIVLYAQWQGELCTLSFNANYEGNAKPLENIEVYYGAKVGILHDLSRHGYIFTGWNTSLYGGGKTFTSNTTVYEEATNVTTLFAQWTAGTYELFFNAMDGSVSPNKKIVTYDANVETLPTPTPPEGYSFGKWNTAPNGSGTDYTASTIYKVAGNTTIYAQWIPNNYTLHFDVNADGGTIDETSRLVAYNSTLAALPVPVRTGYSFTGWNMEKNGSGTVYYEGDTYTELQNTVLYAQWTAKQYIITFENNGGGEIKPSNPKNVTYDLPIGTLPVANRDNYDFKGWNTLSNGKGNSYTATDLFLETENIALYAVWTGKPYTIIFDANGGSVNPDTETVNFGSQTSKLPVPTRDGYTFTGWHDIYNNFYNNDTYYNVPGDITLHAQWEINNYTIEYYDRDDLYITRHFDYNTFVTLPAPSRTGYTLTEWNT